MHRIVPLFILIGLFLTLPGVTDGNNPAQVINTGSDDPLMQSDDNQSDSVLIIYTGKGKQFEPGKINHLVFKISNTSLTPKRLKVQMAFPDGLKSILPFNAFTILPGESKIDRISFNLPVSFPAGNHQMEIIFKETETENVLYRETITMEVPEIENISFDLLEIPSFVTAGEQINVSYLLKNLGNSEQKIRIETYQCDKVTPAFIELEAGATSVVKVVANTSDTYKSAGVHNFSVRAHVSDQMKKENFQSVSVFPLKEEKADPWFRFPVNLSARYIARGREGDYQQGYQLEASGKGFLDTEKKHALEFMARGPNNFDLSFLGFYDEYYIGYKNKNLESFIGSKTYQLTPLLEMSRYGYGTENTFISGKGNKVGFYYVEPRFYKEIESETGAYALLNIFKDNSIGVNYLRKKMSHDEGQAILGSVVATLHPFSATTVEMEYSAGGFPEKKDDAFRLRMTSQHKVISLSGNYFNTGKDFAGYYSNSSFYDANLHVNLSRALSVSLSAREDFTHASLDTLLNTAPYSKMYMSTLNLRLSSDFSVRMFFLDNMRKDRMQQKKFDYHSQTANLWLDRTTQKFSWQLGGEYGNTQNYLAFTDAENRQNSYRGSIRLSYSPTVHIRVNSFASYTNMNSFISPDQKNLLWGISAYGQIHRNLTLNFQVQNSYNIEEYYQNRNLFQLSVDYNFLKRHKLNLASFYTLFQSQLDKPDYSIALTYSVNIGIPVKRTTEFGTLSGKISRQDGEPAKKIILMLNGNKSITADDGSFIIRNLIPGRYSLTVDRSKLEMDEIVNIPIPLQIEISGRQETSINLRLVKAAHVKGKIRAAEADASISALNQAPPQSGNIVLEMKDALETVRIITQPDGTFEFPSLRPSDWTLRIYKNNIDPSYNLEQEYTDLKLQPGELRDIIIELQPKTKRIIFKSAPLMVASSPGNKEKNNRSDQDNKIKPENLGDLWFTVQVASSNLVADEGETRMKGVGEVTVRKVDGLYKYYSGRFSDYRAARAHARKMADIVPGAFLTAFEGDKPLPLKEAIDIWKLNRK